MPLALCGFSSSYSLQSDPFSHFRPQLKYYLHWCAFAHFPPHFIDFFQRIYLNSFIFLFSFFVCEEDWPWANICCQSSSFCLRKIVPKLTAMPVFLYFLYMGCHHSMAWWAVCRSTPRIWTHEPQAAEAEHANNHYTMGLVPSFFLM